MFSGSGQKVGTAAAAAGLFLILLWSVSGAVFASHLTCSLTQLSDTVDAVIGGEAVAISGDGQRVLVLSREDRTGQNPNRRLQLFLIDLDRGATAQLTRLEVEGVFIDSLSASDDLRRVLFRSAADLTGENPERALQVFLFDTAEREFRQITSGASDFTDPEFPPVISGDGSSVAMISRLDPLAMNADGSHEVFVYDVETGDLRQVTSVSRVRFVKTPSLSRDGKRLAVRITRSGLDELFLYDLSAENSVRLAGAVQLGDPVMDGAGTRVLFVAEVDPFAKNPDGGPEIFAVSVQPSPPGAVEGPITQLTELTGVTWINGLTISGDGNKAAFRANGNPLGGESRGANLFVLDLETREITQVTFLAAGGVGPHFRLDRDGDRIVVGLNGNPTAINQDGNREAFLARCEEAAVYFFPQVGSGVAGDIQFRTNFVFANTGETDTVTLEFFDSLGQPAAVALKGQDARSTFVFELPRGRPVLLETGDAGALSVGYARVRAGAGVTGTAIFTGVNAATGTTLYEAAVPLTRSLTDFSVVVNTLGNFQTGLAMVNVDDPRSADAVPRAEVHMRLYSQEFELLGEKTLTLAAGEHAAQFFDQVFSDVPGVREMVGLMTVSSTRPLAVIALRVNDDPRRNFPAEVPTLTTLPVAPGRPDR